MTKYASKLWAGGLTLKLFIIAIVALLLLIPGGMIQNIISERAENREKVMAEVQEKWGNPQMISGPLISLPYKEYYTKADDTETFRVKKATFLPHNLEITGTVEPHIRKRSLYRVLLYKSHLQVQGSFTRPNLSALNIKPENVLWNQAELLIGITDLRGLQEQVRVTWGKYKNLEAIPGLAEHNTLKSGLAVPLTDSIFNGEQDAVPFNFTLHLNGSRDLEFTPVGKTTRVKLSSPWGSPSFHGSFLPEHNITKNDFEAHWNILHLNRNFPQQWKDSQNYRPREWGFGVELLFPVNPYQKAERAVKYAIIFIT